MPSLLADAISMEIACTDLLIFQMVDRLVVQSQDTINALSIDPVDNYSKDIETAKALIQDADNSKTVSFVCHRFRYHG